MSRQRDGGHSVVLQDFRPELPAPVDVLLHSADHLRIAQQVLEPSLRLEVVRDGEKFTGNVVQGINGVAFLAMEFDLVEPPGRAS